MAIIIIVYSLRMKIVAISVFFLLNNFDFVRVTGERMGKFLSSSLAMRCKSSDMVVSLWTSFS